MTAAEDQARAARERYVNARTFFPQLAAAAEMSDAIAALLAERSVPEAYHDQVVGEAQREIHRLEGLLAERPLDRVTDEMVKAAVRAPTRRNGRALGATQAMRAALEAALLHRPEGRVHESGEAFLASLESRPEGREAAEEWEPDPRTLRWAAAFVLGIRRIDSSAALGIEADRLERQRAYYDEAFQMRDWDTVRLLQDEADTGYEAAPVLWGPPEPGPAGGVIRRGVSTGTNLPAPLWDYGSSRPNVNVQPGLKRGLIVPLSRGISENEARAHGAAWNTVIYRRAAGSLDQWERISD